jgi:hypothetical protein
MNPPVEIFLRVAFFSKQTHLVFVSHQDFPEFPAQPVGPLLANLTLAFVPSLANYSVFQGQLFGCVIPDVSKVGGTVSLIDLVVVAPFSLTRPPVTQRGCQRRFATGPLWGTGVGRTARVRWRWWRAKIVSRPVLK